MCAPNDIWSLGVILVNLACGRNPWKQASSEDSTYRAFTKDPSFLKTILPLSDDLNDILCRIFERRPEKRITVGELKQRIINCSNFSSVNTLATPPASPRTAAVSDEGSVMSEGSLSDSCSTLSDDSDYDSGYDSASEPEPEQKREAIVKPSPPATRTLVQPSQFIKVPVVRPAPAAPASQHYVLPSQEFHGSHWNVPQKFNTWYQPTMYGHPQQQQPHYGMQTSHYYPVYQSQPPIHSPIHSEYPQYVRACWA